ncbi:MAG: L-serine ammonia-lyase, iron-sulfur-dependent, subunit alpha [Defluviitaleaceae bacterium]|nr:L-serine ammonia-lyase, iron-sulfur-dependent, subunit alpha [Defluviitaleaceae bacterium]
MIMYNSLQAIIEQAEKENVAISAIILRQTVTDTERSEEDIINQMARNLSVMKEAVAEGCKEGLKSISGLTGDWAFKVKSRFEAKQGFCGIFVGEVIYNALAVMHVNACMGRVVAAPTAGSCGILPGCLIALQNHHKLTDRQLIDGLLNASAIGMVIAKNATLSGAEGACQAECGSGAAMAASAITEIMGGTPSMCGIAAAQSLKGLMGLVCDPVAGLVEEPCIIRNATSAMVALCSAEMALSGIPSLIPVDEVIKAMDVVGKQLPVSLRETAEGGIAASPTGIKLAAGLQNNNRPSE